MLLNKPISAPSYLDPSSPLAPLQKQDDYPVFGEMNLPDPGKYSAAIDGAFKNFSGTLGNMWGEMKGMMKPSETPGIQGSDPRPVNYGFTETESPVTSDSGSGSGDATTQWYGSPWMHLGSKNGMNQFQRTMGGLAQSRMKKTGLY